MINDSVKTSLVAILEGTYITESDNELDLKNEKWCSCKNPNGFNFVKAEGRQQIWRHINCGGLVIRPMYKHVGEGIDWEKWKD